MRTASLVVKHQLQNAIFELDSLANRDNCHHPYFCLREEFKKSQYQIDTSDITNTAEICFELHLDVQHTFNPLVPTYALLFETSQVKPNNQNQDLLSKYQKIFTWNDELVDGKKFIKINFPNNIIITEPDGFSNRTRFCCLIAGNKTLAGLDKRDLYVERIKTIKWFERHAPESFDLYGIDWDIPAIGRGLFGKITRRIFKALKPIIQFKPFPSYRGKVESKREVLLKTKFAICYENVSDLPGYITEKIFDCFFAGCIPVYWGASNVTDYIPADCFIDRKAFKTHEALYAHLQTMSETNYKAYQQRIAAFLSSDAAKPFSSEVFAETIVNTIVSDLNIAN